MIHLKSIYPLLWYVVFGALHELSHVVVCLWLAPSLVEDRLSAPIGRLTWWFDVLISRQTSLEFSQSDGDVPHAAASSRRIDIIHHVGWMTSLALAIAVTWIVPRANTHFPSSTSVQLMAWLTAVEALCTDLFRFAGMHYAWPTMAGSSSAYVFYCGNFGIILLHQMWHQDHAGRQAALDCLEHMVQITMMRGAQSGGVVTYQHSARGMTGKRVRVVNKKRTDLSKELRKRVSIPSNLCPEDIPILQGHTRFATSSLSSLAGTHPHQWTPPTVRCIYDFETQTFGDQYVENFVTHNGDFDFYVLNGKTYDVETVILWLANVLKTPAPAMVDSLGIAGMIDVLRCQGSFALAARYALSLGLRTSTMDCDSRLFPTKAQFDRIGSVFVECWNNLLPLHDGSGAQQKLSKEDGVKLDSCKSSPCTDSVIFRSKLAMAATQILLKRMELMEPLHDYSNLSNDEEDANYVQAFCMVTVHAFLDHDLFYSTQVFLANAKGSFGLVISSSLDSHRSLVIAARGQTMSVAFYPQTGLICFGSEQAATKSGLTARCPIFHQNDFDISIGESDIDRDATRLDLDDLGGEVVLLDFAPPQRPASGRRLVSRPSRYLTTHLMMNGAVGMVIYQESKSSTLDRQIYHRLTRLTRNDLIQPLPDFSDDPILQDIEDIPQVCRKIQEDFHSSKAASGMNRLTAFHLAAVLRTRLDQRMKGRIAPDALDFLLTGCEVSLWLAEQFSADLKKCFPKLAIQALSSNKILGMYGQEIQIPSLGFPQTTQALNLNDTIVIIVSHSGGTFAPLACSNLLQSATKHIFVVTGDWDTQIGKNLRLMNQLDEGGEHVLNHRIFSTSIGIRSAEPCSLSVVATHQLLTNLLKHLSVVILSDDRYRRVTGATITAMDIEVLETCGRLNIAALTDIVGVNSAGFKLDRQSHVRKMLHGAGDLWAEHILENARGYIMSFIYIFVTVISGYPLMYAITTGAGLDKESLWIYVVKTMDSCIYFFLPQICITLLRLWQGRNLLHRMVGRTVVIGDIPWVAQSAEAFLSKIFATSYSIAGVHVISGNPADHLVHRHTHRVVRGTLAIFGRPDGRLSALSTAEAAVCLSVNQASSIQSRGGTCETITLGHNPFKLGLSLSGIFLKRHRPLFLCERLLVESDVKNETLEEKNDDELWRSSVLQRLRRALKNRSTNTNLDMSMSIHQLDASITLKSRRSRSAPALLGAYLDLVFAGVEIAKDSTGGDVDGQGKPNEPIDKVISEAIQHRKQDERIQQLFSRFDKDGDGVLNEQEFIDGLRMVNADVTEREGCVLFRQNDSDGSGRISFREFEGFVEANGFGVSTLKIPPSHRDSRGIIQIHANKEKYFGENIRKFNSGKKLKEEVDFELVRRQHLAQELYETRIAAMQRFVSLCVLFHRMGYRVERFFSSISFGFWSYRMDRTHSIMRIATTASPISGASVRQSMEQMRLLKKVQHSVDVISAAYLAHKKRKELV